MTQAPIPPGIYRGRKVGNDGPKQMYEIVEGPQQGKKFFIISRTDRPVGHDEFITFPMKKKSRPSPSIKSVRVTRYVTQDGHHHDTLAAAREHAARCDLLQELHDGYCYNSLSDEMSGTTYADLVEWMLNRAEPLSRILREYHNRQANQVEKPQ